MKALDRIRAHPAVAEVVDERAEGCGYWVYLKPGYYNPFLECSTIHETRLAEIERQLRHVTKGVQE